MNDEIIVLSEACHSLTDDKIIRQKLHDDYSYQLRKPESNLYRGFKLVNKAKPKKTKSSQMEQNQQMVEVITVKADEFYFWVKKQISEKKLPITIKSKLPEKYTAPVHVQALPLTMTPTFNSPHFGQIYSNPSPDQRLIMQLDELIFKNSKRISFLEEENDKLKN